MKIVIQLFLSFITLVVLNSCRNKTVVLLSKKWDCVQVDNILPPNSNFLSGKDSANAEQVRSILQSINWTFKKNMGYECALNNRITVSGKYQLLEDDKVIICTSASKNSINRYIIKSLTENELVLIGNAENTGVVLHFKPN